jgi:hypothetical protein
MKTTLGFLIVVGSSLMVPPTVAPQADLPVLEAAPGVPALPAPGEPPLVLVFARTDCPVCNRYAPELRRLYERFAPQGVRFFLVYADPAGSAAAVASHVRAFGYGMTPVRDPAHTLVRLAAVRVTPEAAVFVGEIAGPRVVYRGRIDDRFAALGKSRPVARTRDLEDVLAALSRGEAVPTRATTAVGCAIAPVE